jgi:hypothetical protein
VTLANALRPRQRAWLDRTVAFDADLSLLLRMPKVDPPRTYATTSHDVICRWARERNAQPAMLVREDCGVRSRLPDLAFTGDREDGLRRVGWNEWFDAFAASHLTFFYRTHRDDGVPSVYFRIADAESP